MFIVTDSNSSASELRPLVRLCPCQNNGSCVDDEDVQRQLDSGARFIVLSCECPAGLTGQLCESDFEACAENNDLCFPGVECVNVPLDVNQTGFTCGPCPAGYHGDGATCIGKTDKFPLAQNGVIYCSSGNLCKFFSNFIVCCVTLCVCWTRFLSKRRHCIS